MSAIASNYYIEAIQQFVMDTVYNQHIPVHRDTVSTLFLNRNSRTVQGLPKTDSHFSRTIKLMQNCTVISMYHLNTHIQ